MEELKRCPFCGGDAGLNIWEMDPFEKLNIYDNDGHWYSVYCHNCCAEGPTEIKMEEAIKSWNKRVS